MGGDDLTPVALWTGRLPRLRPLPKAWTLVPGGLVAVLGVVGAFGVFGRSGAWLGPLGSLAAGWVLWRHRWPSDVPLRLRSSEEPQGPDEREVIVTFRHDEMLIGWDVGILWFERSGVGFVGKTVSFVLPRALMEKQYAPSFEALVRVPRLFAKVGATTIGFVPLARGLKAEMTLARLDALPTDSEVSETILPPTSLHPDLLQRGMVVRRRFPVLLMFGAVPPLILFFPGLVVTIALPPFARLFSAVVTVLIYLYFSAFGQPLPSSIRSQLPKAPRKRGAFGRER